MVQTPAHRAQIALHDPAVLLLGLRYGFEKVSRHHRREQARDHQRRQNREHRGPAKLLEEQARHATHESRGQKHRDQRKGGGDHRHPDLGRRVGGGGTRGFAHAQMARDVFDLDNRVIDQHAHDQRQRNQRHRIQRIAKIR